MKATDKTAFAMGLKDEKANTILAKELVDAKDKKGIKEIAEGLTGDNPDLANDCIKVLYEIGYIDPSLIAGYAEGFMDLLKSKNNRLVWGAAIALGLIAEIKAEYLFGRFDEIYKAYDKGSVITRDNSISIFAGLVKGLPAAGKKVMPIILKHLNDCRLKEVPQHAERAFVCINKGNAAAFSKVLQDRLVDLNPAQAKRIDKILKCISPYFSNPG